MVATVEAPRGVPVTKDVCWNAETLWWACGATTQWQRDDGDRYGGAVLLRGGAIHDRGIDGNSLGTEREYTVCTRSECEGQRYRRHQSQSVSERHTGPARYNVLQLEL